MMLALLVHPHHPILKNVVQTTICDIQTPSGPAASLETETIRVFMFFVLAKMRHV